MFYRLPRDKDKFTDHHVLFFITLVLTLPTGNDKRGVLRVGGIPVAILLYRHLHSNKAM